METNDRRPSRGTALVHGLPGHPLHPPLTDATIGMFVLATGLAVLGALGAVGDAAGQACWLALIGGLIVAVPTAATGLADWVRLEWGSRHWRTATLHLAAMSTALVLFAIAAWLQHAGYDRGEITTGGLIFTLHGLVALTAGGWLGGAVVFVHGVRVLAADAPGGPDRQRLEIASASDDEGATTTTTTSRR
jgi:uncharacterized membrane protein